MSYANSNKKPLAFIDDVIDRLSEIIWWNRKLTKLENEKYFSNYKQILSKGLVERKGPYIEYIPNPLKSNNTFHEFSKISSSDDILRDSFYKILFKGRPKKECYLYDHQERAYNSILNKNKDVVLSVPTSGGKTEAFMLPVLQSCLNDKKLEKEQNGSLNTIILYPMKSLAVDQFNRLLKYVNQINSSIDVREGYRSKIRIALWDGDTPETVGISDYMDEGGIEKDTPIRGLLCPECGKKLLIDGDDFLYCEDCGHFLWAHVTRKSIKKNAEDISILLTNPESIDYMFINKNDKVKKILGIDGKDSNVKNIVLDEAHTWRGLQGAHINLLAKRLRNFYKNNDPNFILVSATIKDPSSLAKNLTGSDEVDIINSKIEKLPEPKGEIDYGELEKFTTTFEDVVKSILFSNSIEDNYKKLIKEYPNLKNALNLCNFLDLINIEDGRIKLNKFGKEIWDRCGLVNKKEIINNSDKGISNLLTQSVFISQWRNLLEERLQEVIHLANHIAKRGDVLNFEKAENIISWMKEKSSEEGINFDAILATCLSLGRAGGLLTDKYHMFLKPNNKIYYCDDCNKLSFNNKCKCGKTSYELNFCKKCHTPIIVKKQTRKDERENDNEDEENNEDTVFPELEDSETIKEYIPVLDHSHCDENLTERNLRDPSVYYPSFVSYILSALSRNISSKKVLSFCDSRTTSETVGHNLINNDYSISVQQIALSYMMENNNRTQFLDLRAYLTKKIKQLFFFYFYNNVTSISSKEILENLENQKLYPLGYPWNMKRLIESSIITPSFIQDKLNDNTEAIIAHEIFNIFYSRSAKFQKQTIRFTGLTPSKLLSKIDIKSIPESVIEDKFWKIFNLFIEKGAIEKVGFDKVKQKISESEISDTKKEKTLTYFEKESEKIKNKITDKNSPLWKRVKVEESTFEISIPEKVGFCERCVSFFPLIKSDIGKCPFCSYENIETGNRLKSNGRLNKFNVKGWPYDHWANELLNPVVENDKNNDNYPVVGIHRAGIPMELRSIIE